MYSIAWANADLSPFDRSNTDKAKIEADHPVPCRLCEAACALTSMERAVIFRYDEVQRRVRAAGTRNLPLEVFAGVHLTVETGSPARLSSRVVGRTVTRTSSPRATSSRTTCEPTSPAPPVTRVNGTVRG